MRRAAVFIFLVLALASINFLIWVLNIDENEGR